MNALELWAGPECTVNRVDDTFFDQLRLTGHHDRADDLDLLADLPISAVRYPLLWERIAPDADASCDWSWSDARLERLRAKGIQVIAGLVHHGSGPRHTDLLDDSFAVGLGDYAGKVARRYPWIEAWTPVNEPVTTARFAALYGIWYPHRRDERSFWAALLNQIDATRLAMRAIREINPAARLIQTDDLGRTYATVPLRDQAAFDNLRRWAGWDLLCGRVAPGHPLFARIAALGFDARLRVIADDPCPPDVIGINHYVTSDRFLDHRIRRYPPHTRGDNGRLRYADVEAVRAIAPGPAGLRGVLREAWARYRIPLAVTETHNGCTRDEQMRWTADAWDAAGAVRAQGVEVRAVTSWAVFGTQGWNTLLTQRGRYEAGAYDGSGRAPRATAVASLLKGLPSGGLRHPVLGGSGWWRRPIRFVHDVVPRSAPLRDHLRDAGHGGRRAPLLIFGAYGAIGRALVQACRHRDIFHVAIGDGDGDGRAEVETLLMRHRPWAAIHAAEHQRGTVALAQACAARGVQCTGVSVDARFDGVGERRESDSSRMVGEQSRSAIAAERAIAASRGLTIRTAALFSPSGKDDCAAVVIRALADGRRFAAAEDRTLSPSYLPHLVDAVLDLMIDGEKGVWHLTSGETLSCFAFAHRVAAACELDRTLIDAVPGSGFVPSSLTSERGRPMPDLEVALADFTRDMAGRIHPPLPAPVALPIEHRELA